ncbi:MAG: two-component system sensor histidine kinase CreC [bacterium]
MKIRDRIILSFALVVGIGFYFLVDHILGELRPRYLEAVEEVLVDEANVLAAFVESEMKDPRIPVDRLREVFSKVSERSFQAKIYKMQKIKVDERLYVTDEKGIVVFDSEGRDEGKDFSQWRDVYLTLRGEYGARTSRDEPNNPASSVLHVAAPIRFAGRTVGVLTLRKPTASINFFLETARPSFVISGAVAALAVILLGILVSTWFTRPIRKLTAYARSVRDGGQPPFPKLGSNEIAEMGAAFEGMREALEGKKYVEAYVQSLTHELKSPIAAIQGAAEILQETVDPAQQAKFLANIRGESARMHQIVERMLELAALESRRELQDLETLDLSQILQQVLERFRGPLLEKGLQVKTSSQGDLRLVGEAFLLESAVQNLLQNAIDFSPPGATLALELTERGDQLALTLADQGPGIPDYAQARIFDRFYSLPRPDTGRKSSGLGLSLVREVARLHQGEITFQNRSEGGAVATLTLAKRPHENPE